MREYSKNACSCGNRTFPNEEHHQGLGNMRPQAECFPGSDLKETSRQSCENCLLLHTPFLHPLCLLDLGIKRLATKIGQVCANCSRLQSDSVKWNNERNRTKFMANVQYCNDVGAYNM